MMASKQAGQVRRQEIQNLKAGIGRLRYMMEDPTRVLPHILDVEKATKTLENLTARLAVLEAEEQH